MLPAVAAVTYPRRRIRVKRFVVATLRAVPVNPVTVGAVNPKTPGTVVALPGGQQIAEIVVPVGVFRCETERLRHQGNAVVRLTFLVQENA